MRQFWRWYQHPTTLAIVRVHMTDLGKAAVYERWGWLPMLDEGRI